MSDHISSRKSRDSMTQLKKDKKKDRERDRDKDRAERDKDRGDRDRERSKRERSPNEVKTHNHHSNGGSPSDDNEVEKLLEELQKKDKESIKLYKMIDELRGLCAERLEEIEKLDERMRDLEDSLMDRDTTIMQWELTDLERDRLLIDMEQQLNMALDRLKDRVDTKKKALAHKGASVFFNHPLETNIPQGKIPPDLYQHEEDDLEDEQSVADYFANAKYEMDDEYNVVIEEMDGFANHLQTNSKEEEEIQQREEALKKEIEKEMLKKEEMMREELKKEALKKEEIKREQLKKEELRKEELKKEELRKEELKKEEHKREELKREEHKREELKREELKREEDKKEELKKEELKREEHKREELKREELKKEEIKKEDHKKEEHKKEDHHDIKKETKHETKEPSPHTLKNDKISNGIKLTEDNHQVTSTQKETTPSQETEEDKQVGKSSAGKTVSPKIERARGGHTLEVRAPPSVVATKSAEGKHEGRNETRTEIKSPEIEVKQIRSPETKRTEIKSPEIEVKHVTRSEIRSPESKRPEIKSPEQKFNQKSLSSDTKQRFLKKDSLTDITTDKETKNESNVEGNVEQEAHTQPPTEPVPVDWKDRRSMSEPPVPDGLAKAADAARVRQLKARWEQPIPGSPPRGPKLKYDTLRDRQTKANPN